MKELPRARRNNVERRNDDGALTEYLAFRVASAKHALPVSIIREIVRSAQLTPVPRAPAAVLGITSFRGRVVTVVDLGRRLDLACAVLPGTAARLGGGKLRILMVDMGTETIGLMVDEVLQVHRLANREIERASTSIGSDVGAHVIGIARPADEEDVLLLLDPKALLP